MYRICLGLCLLIALMIACEKVSTTPTPTLVSPTQTTAVVATTTRQLICIVQTNLPDGHLFVRSGPGLEYPSTDVAKEGQQLRVIQQGKWSLVQTPAGSTGWVNSAFCPEAP